MTEVEHVLKSVVYCDETSSDLCSPVWTDVSYVMCDSSDSDVELK